MKRRMKRLPPKAVQQFLAEMQKLAQKLNCEEAPCTVKHAAYLWAADELYDYLEERHYILSGDEGYRAFLEWLRTEPPRIERLLTAANRHAK